ncbi:GntR family transcriptional regulator [Arthrobacter gyeryongensis]|uniref:GntR family transcriptional regulator n=1 Tax=Arthrobacter gyeryongensis TaxID=1650592 RepID=UPI0031EAA3CB
MPRFGLAERLGVSRTPVREALQLLEKEGIVRIEKNRGVRVLHGRILDGELRNLVLA